MDSKHQGYISILLTCFKSSTRINVVLETTTNSKRPEQTEADAEIKNKSFRTSGFLNSMLLGFVLKSHVELCRKANRPHPGKKSLSNARLWG
jgi:hypothetical protein